MRNVIDNYDNKLQAGLNISIHISHIHLQQYYVKFFRRKPVPPGLTLTGYCPVVHTNSNSQKQVDNEESRSRKYCHLNKPSINNITKKVAIEVRTEVL